MLAMNSRHARSIGLGIFLGLAAPGLPAAYAHPSDVVLENPNFRYVIGTNGQNQAFLDRATGTNHLRSTPSGPCALAWKAGKTYPANSATLTNEHVSIRFAGLDTALSVAVTILPSHLVFHLDSVQGELPDKVELLNLELDLQGRPEETFGVCALALNLKTRVDALPALQRDVRFIAESARQLAGARIALVAAPMQRMLPSLQSALSASSELPVCKVAGPWAAQAAFSRGSYLFNFGSLSATNLEEWITTVQSLGFGQIDNHGGGNFFRFGDFQLDAQRWPDGWATWEKEIVPRLNQAGIGAIFHTYAFFIDKRSKYVAPVPDSRLDAFRSFTLARPLTPDATELVVNEPITNLSLITGFFEQNSVTLHLGDELVTFGGFSKQAPWTLSKLTRGAHGTKAAPHAEGTRARHLKEMFGLFVPDVDTSLFEEIAANHAAVVNQCGFQGIYLDAIDGAGILRGPEQAWYWGGKFVVDIQKRLNRPVGMEMSAMWHHFWQYRTRWQAWDYPVRGQVRFIDLHAQSINGGLLLPLHLGWWNFNSFASPQIEPSYPNVMETLGARLVGWDAGISLTAAAGKEALATTPLFRRAAEILRTCEDLRHSGVYNESARARLRAPGSEFALVKNAAGRPRFQESQSHPHAASLAEPSSLNWRITNSFKQQPLRFRLEALVSAAPTNSTAVLLVDFTKTAAAEWKRSSAAGVSFDLGVTENLAVLSATNRGPTPRNAAWARLERQFDPPLNCVGQQALAVTVHGDNSGAILAIRLESPEHISYGAVADRYVVLDFTGPRTLTLVETESSRWSDYSWDDGKGVYNVYRETIKFDTINKVSVWLQNIPENRETQVMFGPIRAVPTQATPLKNPVITMGPKKISLAAEVPAGGWIEGNSLADCSIYGPKGEAIGKATVSGEWPSVPAGTQEMGVGCDGSDRSWRARLVVFTSGEEL